MASARGPVLCFAVWGNGVWDSAAESHMRVNGDIEQLLQELRSPNPAERLYVLTALAMADDPEAEEALIDRLDDPDRDCRATAARMVGQRQSRRAVPALVSSMLDVSRGISQEAAEALGRIGDPRAVEPLLVVLQEHAAPARAAAAKALGALGGRGALQGLCAALHDPMEAVRAEAAEALGELKAEESVPALMTALGDGSDRVRQSALIALQRLGQPALHAFFTELRSSERSRRLRAAWALGEFANPAAAEPLVRALRDTSEDVRAQAALALGSLGAREAVPSLRELLGDSSPVVREAAALSLSRLGEPHAMPEPARGREATDGGWEAPSKAPTGAPGVEPDRRQRIGPVGIVRLLDRALLLFATSVFILIVVVIVHEVLQTREIGGPPARVQTPTTGESGGVSQSQKSKEQLQTSRSPAEGAPVQKTKGETESKAAADCQIVTRAWYIEAASVIVRGRVVNSGKGVARKVAVRVTLLGTGDSVLAEGETLVVPEEILPGHSGEFLISVPLPRPVARPRVTAQVYWE